MRRLSVLASALLAAALAAAPAAAQLRTVPPAFHGGWDERASACEGPEPRFSITARSVWSFEIQWRVRRVRWLGRTEIEVDAQHVDHDGRLTADRQTFRFRLVDNGRAIAGSGVNFRRCARPVQRN